MSRDLINTWVKVFRINSEFRILRLAFPVCVFNSLLFSIFSCFFLLSVEFLKITFFEKFFQ